MIKFNKAMMIAQDVHQYQEYAGLPYFFHPLRVATMLGDNMRKHHDRDTCVLAMCVAMLHDSIEDSEGIDREFVRANIRSIDERILPMVEALSRKPNQKYLDYINSLQKKPAIVGWVKLCDLRDHLLHGDTLRKSHKSRYLMAHLALTGQQWKIKRLPPMFSVDPLL